MSELGELLSDLCTSARSAHSLKSEEPFRFLGAGDFAENDFLSADGLGRYVLCRVVHDLCSVRTIVHFFMRCSFCVLTMMY